MSAWNSVLGVALLGSERAASIPSLPPELAGVEPGGEAPEQRLLGYAAALSPWMRAGQQPAATSLTIAPSEPDMLRAAGPRASHALGTILTGDYGFLLPEWCTAASAGKRRVPDHLLPEFLDRLAREGSALRSVMQAVLGARGAWLASLNPAWTITVSQVSGDPSPLWQTGTRAERTNLLAVVRAANPAAARALVQSTMETDQPEEVAGFVAQLRPGLSMDDHDFLEKLLDARHKPVRLAAARLLAQLPESAFAQRMTERAAARLTFKPPTKGLILKRKGTIEATLPDKEEKALTRDGVDLNRKRGKLGPKAMALLQIVAATPLGWFTKQWNATPADILDAATESEWSEALLAGWAEAAITQRDATWADALMQRQFSADGDTIGGLFLILPPTRRDELVVETLTRDPKTIQDASLILLLDAGEHPFSEALSRLVLKAARRFYLGESVYSLRQLMPRLAGRLAPGLAAEAAEGWPVDHAQWHAGDRAMLERLVSTLELRRNYLEELGS